MTRRLMKISIGSNKNFNLSRGSGDNSGRLLQSLPSQDGPVPLQNLVSLLHFAQRLHRSSLRHRLDVRAQLPAAAWESLTAENFQSETPGC